MVTNHYISKCVDLIRKKILVSYKLKFISFLNQRGDSPKFVIFSKYNKKKCW